MLVIFFAITFGYSWCTGLNLLEGANEFSSVFGRVKMLYGYFFSFRLLNSINISLTPWVLLVAFPKVILILILNVKKGKNAFEFEKKVFESDSTRLFHYGLYWDGKEQFTARFKNANY